MSDNSDFSDSDGGDLIKELEKLDDLDGDLFGNKSKKVAKSAEDNTASDHKKLTAGDNDFNDDEDDPFADPVLDETKTRTRNLLQKSKSLAAAAASKEDSSNLDSSKVPKLKRQDSFDSPTKDKKNLDFLDSSEQTKTSPRKKTPPKSNHNFEDDDILGELGFDSKPKKAEVMKPAGLSPKKKVDVEFGDEDDLLDGLGFGTKKQEKVVERAPATQRSLSFMDDLMGTGSNKKESASQKEFQLGDRYKSSSDKGQADGGYNPTSVTSSSVPRRRRGIDEPSTSPKARSQRTLDTLFDNPPETTKPPPDPRPLPGRRPASSAASMDWLGVNQEAESPKKLQSDRLADGLPNKAQNDWLGVGQKAESPQKLQPNRPSARGQSSDWLGTADEVPAKSKEGGNEATDWLEMKKKIKPPEESIASGTPRPPLPTTTTTKSPSPSPKHSSVVIESKPAVPIPSFQQSSPTVSSEMSASLARETANLVANLKGLAASAQVEKDQMMKTIEGLTERHKEELKSMEAFYKNQMKVVEDMQRDSENRSKDQLSSRMGELQEALSRLEKEKSEQALHYQQWKETSERDRKQEVERLKEIHSKSLLSLRQEHQDALNRLQRLKEQELEAMTSAQEHTRSVQHVMSELEAKTSQLSLLQEKLEGKHQHALEERRAALEAKEQHLKATEVRHKRLYDEGEEDRARLQQLVLRLERRLVEQTKDLEDERWKVLQERGKLESHTKALEEKQAEIEYQVVRDRTKLQQAKEMCLEEQRSAWLRVSQERQSLGDRESVLRRKEDELHRLHRKIAQDETRFESEQRVLQQEKLRLEGERLRLQEDMGAIARAREAVQAQKSQLRDEGDRLNIVAAQIKHRERELDEAVRKASEIREEGLLALASAKQLEISLQEKKKKVAQQIQTLHEKEHKLMKDRMSMLDESQQLENNRNSLICANCRLAYIRPLEASQMQNNTTHTGAPSLQPALAPSFLQQVSNQPNLIIWKLWAEKDKEFLKEESQYLDSLNLLDGR